MIRKSQLSPIGWISFVLLIFSYCSSPRQVYQGQTIKSYTIQELRTLYSSGNLAAWPKAMVDSAVIANGFKDIGPLGKIPFPDNNQYSKQKYELGKILFHDPRLSKSNQIACASCHDPQLGWGDGKRVAFGHDRKTGKRNAMSLFNVAYYNHLFWDGRANNLEQQATMPIQDTLEMHELIDELPDELAKIKGYPALFNNAFGDNRITKARIVMAIATFERKIVSPKSRFDLFVLGDSTKLTDNELKGLHLFRTKARCINCHNTPLFSDNQFHNDGQTLFGSVNEDLGRYLVTNNKKDIGAFKTPSLREVNQTGPWMHHGNFPTLLDVVQFYNLGNPNPIQKKYLNSTRDSLLPTKSPLLKELHLSKQEIKNLLAFLNSISTTPKRMRAPKLP